MICAGKGMLICFSERLRQEFIGEIAKRFVQRKVFDRSPPGRHRSEKYLVHISPSSRFDTNVVTLLNYKTQTPPC